MIWKSTDPEALSPQAAMELAITDMLGEWVELAGDATVSHVADGIFEHLHEHRTRHVVVPVELLQDLFHSDPDRVAAARAWVSDYAFEGPVCHCGDPDCVEGS